MEKVTLLLDGDELAYKIAFRNQQVIDFDGEKAISVTEDEHQLILDIWDSIQYHMKQVEATDYFVCLSDDDNFRYKILSSYKSNREDKDKPQLLGTIRNLIELHHPTLKLKGLEADDVMGIYSTSSDLIEGKKIIGSRDKDMKTIPGWLYNTDKGDIDYISEEEANLWHMTQTITGDTVDGYAGCPGRGPDAASKALAGAIGLADMWERVTQVYIEKALKDALVQAQVANILRADQYNFKNGRIKKWTPPLANV